MGELPNSHGSDFNRQVIRFTRHTLQLLNLCDEIIPMITEVHNKKGRTIADPALLKINRLCVFRYFLNFLRAPANPISPRPRSSMVAGSGTFTFPTAMLSASMAYCVTGHHEAIEIGQIKEIDIKICWRQACLIVRCRLLGFKASEPVRTRLLLHHYKSKRVRASTDPHQKAKVIVTAFGSIAVILPVPPETGTSNSM